MNKKQSRLISTTLSAAMILNGLASTVHATGIVSAHSGHSHTMKEEAPAAPSTETVTQDEQVAAQSDEGAVEEKKEEKTSSREIEEEYLPFTVNTDDLDFTNAVTDAAAATVEGTVVDENDPTIKTITEELKNITVMDEETGKQVELTEEQIATIAAMYQTYMDFQTENADIFGLQTPFFLSYNDNLDGIGVIGEMLVLAGYTLDDVRKGNYGYDDITGMITAYIYGDKFSEEYYRSDIEKMRDEALQYVKDSGAVTEAQKLTFLNDWMTMKVNFDMSFIMNMDKEEAQMVAQDEQPHPHYEDMASRITKDYEGQIEQQFRGQFEEAIYQQVRDGYWPEAIKATYAQMYLNNPENENPTQDEADEYAAKKVEEDQDLISEDPEAYVKDKLPEAADDLIQGCEDAVEKVKDEGIPNEDGTTTPVKDMVDYLYNNQPVMDTNGDDEPDATAAQMVPAIAQQAGSQIANGIFGYWKGTQVGVLAEGSAVCLGYAETFNYIVQCMHPEVYLKNGATDYKNAANWKTVQELYYDDDGNLLSPEESDFLVDTVRITYEAQVTTYGETPEEPFTSDHFWNAVRIGEEWYYCDPCYTDTFTEVMMRNRAETNGYINHMYHLFSDASARQMYDGNYKDIDSFVDADDKSYESSWIARAKSMICPDGQGNAYYVYNSSDLINKMGSFDQGNMSQDSFSGLSDEEDRIKLVMHKMTETDYDNSVENFGDQDYTTLIDFNSPVEDGELDETEVLVRVKNEDGEYELVKDDLLTEIYAEHKAMTEIYPSVNITCALQDGKLLFNLSKYILSYDLETCEVTIHKSYDEVTGKRDLTQAFGASAFSVVNGSGDFTFENHPIAGIAMGTDGKLDVAIATNLAYISGKDNGDRSGNYINDNENNGFGFEFEETNYNPEYQNYGDFIKGDDADMMDQFLDQQDNDNDEFLWVANFATNEDPASLVGEEIEYEPINCDHHWVLSEETYFTKDEDTGAWKTGTAYICVKCSAHVSDPGEEPEKKSFEDEDDYAKKLARYEKKKAAYEAVLESNGHIYDVVDANWADDNSTVTITKLEDADCAKHVGDLDFFQTADQPLEVTLSEAETFETTSVTTGKCSEGTVTVYTAEGTTKEGYRFKVTKEVKNEAGEHPYNVEWVFADDNLSATVSVECPIDGDKHEGIEATKVEKDEEASKPATCTEDGVDVYVATADITDDEGNIIQTVTGTKEVVLPKLEHEYEASFSWSDDYSKATATATCKTGGETLEAVDAVVTKDEEKSKPASCTEDGLDVLIAKATFTDEEGNVIFEADSKPVEVVLPKEQHDIAVVITWDGKNATATAECSGCETEFTPEVVVERDAEKSVDPTCQTEGKDVLNATATVKDEEGNVLATSTSSNTVTVPKLKHNLSLENVKFTWDGFTSAKAEATCSVGGETLTADCQIAKDTEKSVEPTATTEGKYVWVATAVFKDSDGEQIATFKDEKEEVVPVITHELTYQWAWTDDHKATVTATCALHEGETFIAEGTVVKVDAESTEPTCQQEGKDVYEASARVLDENGDLIGTPTDKHEYTVAKLKHNLSSEDVKFEWTGFESATAEATCSVSGEVIKAAEVTIAKDEEKSEAPTATKEGKNVYVATAVFKDGEETIATFKDEKTEVLPKNEVTAMYRLYNPNSGEHFYTANPSEKQMLVDKGWTFESIGWYAPVESNTPVYRLYNPNAGDHHYTKEAGERDILVSKGWIYERIGWYSCDEEEVPLYRQYNPNAKQAGAHNYTTNKAENDHLVSLGWREEGIGWYGCKY